MWQLMQYKREEIQQLRHWEAFIILHHESKSTHDVVSCLFVVALNPVEVFSCLCNKDVGLSLMNHKREITNHAAVEGLFLNNKRQRRKNMQTVQFFYMAMLDFFFNPFSGGGYELWKLLEINSRRTHKTPVSSMGAWKPELLIASHKSLTPLFCHQVAGLHFWVGFMT